MGARFVNFNYGNPFLFNTFKNRSILANDLQPGNYGVTQHSGISDIDADGETTGATCQFDINGNGGGWYFDPNIGCNVAPLICDLDIGHQHIELLAPFGLPDHLFIKELSSTLLQQLNDTLTMAEVVPKLSGIEEVQFLLLITEQLP